MALTIVDRSLLQACLNREEGAWQDFVDRFLSLIYHTIHHTAYLRSVPLKPEDVEDIASEILIQIVAKDYSVLRQFRGQASLGTYLTVIARRTAIHELAKRQPQREVEVSSKDSDPELEQIADTHRSDAGLENLEEVQALLRKLPSKEREVVRLSYIEGRTYEEISTQLRIPVNSIGPILTRAKARLRQGVKKAPRVVRAYRRKPREEAPAGQ